MKTKVEEKCIITLVNTLALKARSYGSRGREGCAELLSPDFCPPRPQIPLSPRFGLYYALRFRIQSLATQVQRAEKSINGGLFCP